ncbi:MlaD family protein [Aquifex sp.]
MESRFKYFVVGSFLLLFTALFVVVVLILYKGFYKVEYSTYLIKTTYSVNGLELGSPVKYKGVNVGKVKHIEINWENPSEILILVDIDKRLNLEGKVYATLGLQGITGLAYISLEESKTPLPIKEERGYPVIPFKPSTFQEISDFIPSMLTEVHNLTRDLRKFINSIDTIAINETVKAANTTLNNLNEKLNILTRRVIKLQEELSLLISDTRGKLEGIDKLVVSLEDTARTVRDTFVEFKKLAQETRSEIPELSDKLEEVSNRLEELMRDIDKFVKKLNASPSELLIRKKTEGAPVEK